VEAHKLLPYLLYPTLWTMLLMLAALLLLHRNARRAATLMLLLAALVLGMFSSPRVGALLWGSLETMYPPQPVRELPAADAIVLLGGGVDLALPPRLEPDLNDAADRLWLAAKLYHAGKAPLIVISGGQVFAQPGLMSEAEYHVELLQQLGVPREAMLLETRSRNTAENARFTAQLLQQTTESREPLRVLIVTSAVHQPRAVLLFRHFGMQPTAATCDVRTAQSKRPLLLDLLPSAHALSTSEGAIREWIGLIYYQLRVRLDS
jgi:uncharacterized SAM-binding protein YcdF (DUF218 family)